MSPLCPGWGSVCVRSWGRIQKNLMGPYLLGFYQLPLPTGWKVSYEAKSWQCDPFLIEVLKTVRGSRLQQSNRSLSMLQHSSNPPRVNSTFEREFSSAGNLLWCLPVLHFALQMSG